jgi:hypothetical protein
LEHCLDDCVLLFLAQLFISFYFPWNFLKYQLTWKPAEAAQTPPCLPIIAALVILPVANSWSSTYADGQREPTQQIAVMDSLL